MTMRHQPNPEFVSNLEWQIKTSLQRKDRFSQPVKQGGAAKARTIFLVLLSGFIGAGAVVASEQVQQSREKEILLVRVQGQQRIAGLQLQMAQANLSEVEERFELGVITEDHMLGVRATVQAVESEIQALRLDEEEIRISGKSPNNELSAPLFGGQDFVTERLRLQLATAQDHSAIFRQRLAWTMDAAAAGLIGADSERQAQASVAFSETEVSGIREKMMLRKRFLDGELTAAEVEAGVEIENAERQLKSDRLTYDLLRQEIDAAIDAVETGRMAESSLKHLRLQLMQLELDMEILQQTLELLREGGG